MAQQLVIFGDDEWFALYDEPHELWKLYCDIRRRMDKMTGISGQVTRISETALYDALKVKPVRGRTKKPYPVSRQRYRSAMQRLVTLGLLEPIPTVGPLVFRLPLAVLDKSVRNMNNRRATNEQPEVQPEENELKHNGCDTSATTINSDEVLKNNQHQDQDQVNNNSSLRSEFVVSTEKVDSVVALYHEVLPELPVVKKITATRKSAITARWREDLRNLDSWRRYFEQVRSSDFLMGKSASPGRKPFRPNLEWLVNPTNYVNTVEGKYNNHNGAENGHRNHSRTRAEAAADSAAYFALDADDLAEMEQSVDEAVVGQSLVQQD